MNSLWIAFSTLTLLPTPAHKPTVRDLKWSVTFYPLVGALLGGSFLLMALLPIQADLRVLLLVLANVGLTGAFHLDGLADCLDGFFGGKNPKDRQRIMKAANLGTYGTVGIVFALLAKAFLFNHLIRLPHAAFWLLAIPIAARWAACLACFTAHSPQGNKGLGSYVIGHSIPIFSTACGFTLLGCVWLEWYALALFVLAAAVSGAITWLSHNRIGGLTGDGLGAIIETTEVILMFLACVNVTHSSLL